VEAGRRARDRRLRVNALNIAIQSRERQNRDSYRELFTALVNLNIGVRYQGDRRLLLSSVWEDETDHDRLIGILDRFTDIDAFNWYNREHRRAATREERANINVPDEMRANYRGFYILFDLRVHLMTFAAYEASAALSARNVAYVFDQLVQHPSIVERFGSVTVSIQQEPAALERILDAPNLRYLSIEIYRPNANLGRLDRDWEDQMDAMRAKKLRHELTADDRDGLRPNREVREAADLALSNGVVEGRVVENGLAETISTQDYPVAETIIYNPDEESPLRAFLRASAHLLHRLAQRFRTAAEER
jgi:Domain of unknown function (DUF4747)